MIDKILYRAVLNVNEFYSFRDAFTPMHRKMYSILKLIGVDNVSDNVENIIGINEYEYDVPFTYSIILIPIYYMYKIPFEQDVKGKEISYIKDYIYYVPFEQDSNNKGISYIKDYIYYISFEQNANSKKVSYIKDCIYYIPFKQEVQVKEIPYNKNMSCNILFGINVTIE